MKISKMLSLVLPSCLALIMLFSSPSHAAIAVYQFDDAQQEQQFHELGKLLRCPKCQNQNIADSNAEIAKDLRKKVYEMTKNGQSKEQIVDYMVTRFGNFVVYEPPVNAATIFLWLGPVLLICFGFIFIVLNTRKRASDDAKLSSNDEQRLSELLAESDLANDESLDKLSDAQKGNK